MHENETKILNSQFKTNSPQFASPPPTTNNKVYHWSKECLNRSNTAKNALSKLIIKKYSNDQYGNKYRCRWLVQKKNKKNNNKQMEHPEQQ